jgi:hypothetical protein
MRPSMETKQSSICPIYPFSGFNFWVPTNASTQLGYYNLMIRYILKSRCSSPKSNIDVYLI